jgi:creatinine amidohydrolase
MCEYLLFENLTSPEVQSLPRDIPLIIPMGKNYPMEQLSEALGNPAKIVLLPDFPFGWRGSGLKVSEAYLDSYVSNLLDSLRDDGFSRVFALTPQGLETNLGANRYAFPSQVIGKTYQSLPPDGNQDKVILIPIGHTEQHGYHLPLSTDTLIIEAITQGTVEALPSKAISLPVMPYGVSTHRSTFAGTLNAKGRTFEDFWLSVIDVLVARSFNRFYLISGHGGNCSFLTNVVKYAGERYPWIFCATSWLYLSGPEGIASLDKHRRSRIGGMGHAGELETSLLLYLHPELTHMDRVIDETTFITTPSYYMDWVEGGALIANPPWKDDTATGAYGAGSLATEENGKLWLEDAVKEKIAHVNEIHEQYSRRKQKRSK